VRPTRLVRIRVKVRIRVRVEVTVAVTVAVRVGARVRVRAAHAPHTTHSAQAGGPSGAALAHASVKPCATHAPRSAAP
jgi:microcystin-dependent protein